MEVIQAQEAAEAAAAQAVVLTTLCLGRTAATSTCPSKHPAGRQSKALTSARFHSRQQQNEHHVWKSETSHPRRASRHRPDAPRLRVVLWQGGRRHAVQSALRLGRARAVRQGSRRAMALRGLRRQMDGDGRSPCEGCMMYDGKVSIKREQWCLHRLPSVRNFARQGKRADVCRLSSF